MYVFLTSFLKWQREMWGLLYVLWGEAVLLWVWSQEDVGGSGLEGLHSVRPLGADQAEPLFPGMKFLAMAHTNKITLFVSVPDDLLLG